MRRQPSGGPHGERARRGGRETGTLDVLRREIDELDATLHDLVIRRTEIVEKIRSLKRGAGGSFLQPGREAVVLRRLVRRHRGPFPKAALVRIWREIMAAHVQLQDALVVAIHEGDGKAGVRDLARDHFGTLAPIRGYDAPARVITAIAEGKATVGVIPVPKGEGGDPWWALLDEARGPVRVIARLPFAGFPGGARGGDGAFVVGCLPFEGTGEDRRLLVCETGTATGAAGVAKALERAGLAGRAIARARPGPGSSVHAILVEVDGGVVPRERLEGFARELKIGTNGVRGIGGYAVPFEEVELAKTK